jgi:hypothetical protein
LCCLQGDINHWVAVLDHFDSFFEQRVAQRSDVQMQGVVAAEDPPFPTEACLAVLSATCVLLENCSNKAAYNSSEVRTHSHTCQAWVGFVARLAICQAGRAALG